MKPYSKVLRLRVLAAVDAGKPREELARTFSESMPTIKRWLRRCKETGDVEPQPIPRQAFQERDDAQRVAAQAP
jgi:transposase